MDNIKLLSDFISIQSVSTDPSRSSEVLKAVEFLKKEIELLGFVVKIYQRNNCPPLIIALNKRATTRVAPTTKLQTIGIYAHYDVQPEDPVEKWESPPFELTSRDGKLFGRGVADDKGHIVQILIAIKKIVETRHASSLQNNIVLIFEGEEENESENFEDLIKKSREDLKDVDAFYVLDSGMKAKNIPQIFYGLRGIITAELLIKTSQDDLHSGVFGNRVINPVQVIAELLSKIKDAKTNTVKIPEFYKDVKKTSKEEIALLSKYVLTTDQEKKNSGVREFIGNFLNSKIFPSFEVNGIKAGYTGDGFKTIIPAEAMMKFSIRLVPDQKPKEIKRMLEEFIKNNLPIEVDYQLRIDDGCDPFYTDFNNKFAIKTAEILTEVFGNKTYFNRSGGSIAAAGILQRLFKKPIILTGFTLPDENIHAPNENIDQEMFEKGVIALEKIFSNS